MTNLTGDPAQPASQFVHGRMLYSWPQRRQRVDHGAGNYECEHFYRTGGPCSLFFTLGDMYASVADTGRCCLDLHNAGTPFRNWTYAVTYVGEDTVRGEPAHHWRALAGVHEYWSASTAGPRYGLPLKFSFPNALQAYYFDLDSMQVGPVPPAELRLPSPACAQACNNGTAAVSAAVAATPPHHHQAAA